MALNINTNITNNLNGYLLDAKNVKGGFVVVEDWSDVESLPSSTKVTGSLIYVVGDTLGGGTNVGFYQCDAIGNWQKRVLGGSGIYQFASQSANNIDYSQTYTYTLTSSQQTKIGDDFARLVDADTTTLPMLIFAFNDTNLLIAMSNLAMGTSGILSHTIIEQNNTQYIVNISIALDFSTITLSFSELQAGSGGGGTGEAVGTLWYQHLFTLHDAYNGSDVRICLTMPKDASSTVLQLVNAQLSTNYTTIDELVEAINQAITGQLITVGDILGLIGFISDISDNPTNCIGTFCLHSVDPTYWYQLLNASNDGTIIAVAGNASSGSSPATVLQQKYQLDLPSSIDIEVTPLGNASGGGSSTGGGSGKLYQFDFIYKVIDSNGDVVKNSSNQDELLYISAYFYEANWIRYCEQYNGQMQTDDLPINFPTNPEQFKDFLNEFVNENNLERDFAIQVSFLMIFLENADKVFGNLFEKPIYEYTNILSWYGVNTVFLGVSVDNQTNELSLTSKIDMPINDSSGEKPTLSNSCTLTEYGTSGGGGGASATRTKYHIEVEDSNSHKAIIPIYKDDFDKYLVEMNQVGQTMATAMGITWTTLNTIDDVKNLFDAQKSTQLAYGCDLAMNLLVKYAYESGENPVLNGYYSGINLSTAVNTIVDYNLQNNFLGLISSINYDSSYVNNYPVTENGSSTNYVAEVNGIVNTDYWFKDAPTGNSSITIDQDATFTYTEEQVAGGSSSGGEVATKKWYEYKLTEGSSSVEHSYIVAKISEEQQNELFAQLSTALGQTISTPQNLIGIYNQLKADDLSNSQTIYQQLVQVWMVLWMMSAQEFRTIYTSAGFGKIPVNMLEVGSIFQDTASGNIDGDKITFDANSILSITETTETVSGGSSQPTEPYTQLANDTPISATTVTITVNDITNYDFVQIGVCNGTHWLWQTAKRSKLSSEALLFQFGNDTIEIGISGTSVVIIPTNATIYEYDIYGVN